MNFFLLQRRLVFLLASIAMLASNVRADGDIYSTPVRTWGEISTNYRARNYAGIDKQATSWLNTGTINASSYIWRPWFATARGGLTLSLDESKFSAQPSEKNQYITGNAGVDLFPSSRFPSQVYYLQAHNEFDDALLKRSIDTSEFNLRQLYRTEDNAHRLRAEYINNTREDPTATDIEGNRLQFSSNSQLESNTLASDIRLDTVEDSFTNDKTDSYALTGRHSYNYQNSLSIDNLVSTSTVENDFIRSATDIDTKEFSSLLVWRPGVERDLNLTGSLRLSDQVLQQTGGQTMLEDDSTRRHSMTVNLNQGLLYQYSDHLLLRESINANQIDSGGSLTLIASESLGFNYTPDRIDVGVGNYGWNFGHSFVHEHGDIETNNISNNRFTHSLDNSYLLGEGRQLRTSLTQAFGYSYQSRDFDREIIDHSFSVTWSQSTNVDQATVRFLLSDAREKEEDDELSQLANLQFNGVLRFDRFTQLGGNATLQWSRREDSDSKSEGTVANGRLEYMRSRMFDVPRLIFRSTLTLSQQQSETEQLIGDVIDNSQNYETWENSVDYLIGRLEARVNFDFVKANGGHDQIFKILFTRNFGDL